MGHRCRAWLQSRPQLQLPMTVHTQAAIQRARSKRPQLIIVAKSSTPQRAAPTSGHGHMPHLQRLPSQEETSKPRRNPKRDAFRKVVTPMAPPSHVQSGLGFHPWMTELEGNTTPPTGKAAPTDVAVARLSPKESSSTNVGPRSRAPCHQTPPSPLSRRFPATPSKGPRRAGCT
jgi:hypothetical protein